MDWRCTKLLPEHNHPVADEALRVNGGSVRQVGDPPVKRVKAVPQTSQRDANTSRSVSSESFTSIDLTRFAHADTFRSLAVPATPPPSHETASLPPPSLDAIKVPTQPFSPVLAAFLLAVSPSLSQHADSIASQGGITSVETLASLLSMTEDGLRLFTAGLGLNKVQAIVLKSGLTEVQRRIRGEVEV